METGVEYVEDIDWDRALEKFPSQSNYSLCSFFPSQRGYVLRDNTIKAMLQKYFQNVPSHKDEYTPKEKEYREKIVSCYSDMFK